MKKPTIRKIFRNHKAAAEPGFRFFSVLVPLVEMPDGLHFVYEVRAEKLSCQPGEICFPGGHMEGDETPCECALRETEEEIGISASDIEIVSQLDTIYSHSSLIMYCYLGIIDASAMDCMHLNADEVDEVFTVPLDRLIETPPELYTNVIVPKPPVDFPYRKVTGADGYSWRMGSETVPVYDIDGRIIWGLTGRITKQFIDVIKGCM